jgi:hypothetical protein
MQAANVMAPRKRPKALISRKLAFWGVCIVNSTVLALAAVLVAGIVAGVLIFTVATGTAGVLNLQSQPVVACGSPNC